MHQPLHYTATNSVAEILENPNITFESIMKCDVASERPLRQQCALWQPHGVYRRRRAHEQGTHGTRILDQKIKVVAAPEQGTLRGSANTERVPRALTAAGRQRLDGMRLTQRPVACTAVSSPM